MDSGPNDSSPPVIQLMSLWSRPVAACTERWAAGGGGRVTISRTRDFLPSGDGCFCLEEDME